MLTYVDAASFDIQVTTLTCLIEKVELRLHSC